MNQIFQIAKHTTLKLASESITKNRNLCFSTVNDIDQSRRLRRVLFNVPGSDLRKIQKATQLNLDCVVLDLEDGVAINQKEAARSLIQTSLKDSSFGRAEKLIRINANSAGSDHFLDLKNCVHKVIQENLLDAIVLPKVETPKDITDLYEFLDSCGPYGKRVKVLAAIESAKGLVNLTRICETAQSTNQSRLEALIFASEDLCANMGMTRTPNATELLYARSHLVTHAVAFDLQAIDMVCLDFKNNETLRIEAEEGSRMGYHGKQAIHPNQISVIYSSFRPSEKDMAYAKKIIDGNDLHQKSGKGAFEIDGKMIDMPMVKWARTIIDRSNVPQ